MIGVEPEGSRALARRAWRPGEPVPVTPRSIADGLKAPFAGETALATLRGAGVESVLVSEEEIEEAFRLLYARAKLACEPAGAAASARCSAAASSRADGRRRLGRQRRRRKPPLLSWPSMKTDIHPEYVARTVRCSCGNEFTTRSTKPELHVEICSACHPFYTGKQKLMDTGGRVERFQRRLEKAGGASRALAGHALANTIGGQAVLEGVMMRSPSNWAVAVRKPDGEIAQVVKDIASPMASDRIFRLPVIRGVIALGESLAIGFRALAISANYAAQEEDDEGEVTTELSRGQIIFAFAIAIGFALMLFKVGPALITNWLPIDTTGTFVVVEGVDPRRRSSSSTSSLDLAAARPEARLPVPRRRAQGDQRLRGRRGADARARAALSAHPPPLRHRVPALGDGDRDLRLRVRRPAGLVLADREPDPAAAGDRRDRLRADPLRRQATATTASLMTLLAPGLWLQRLTTREPTLDQIEVSIRRAPGGAAGRGAGMHRRSGAQGRGDGLVPDHRSGTDADGSRARRP